MGVIYTVKLIFSVDRDIALPKKYDVCVPSWQLFSKLMVTWGSCS